MLQRGREQPDLDQRRGWGGSGQWGVRVRLRPADRAGVRTRAHLQSAGGVRPHPAAQTLLNLKESWQEARQEEQRELVQIMLQEVACSIQEQQVTWVKPQPGFEILFKLVNDLQPDEKGRFFLK